MNLIGTIRQLPTILKMIETDSFLPSYSYHLRGRKGQMLSIAGGGLCYPLKESPNSVQLKQWLVEIEDKRFHQHGAIDPKGILRALIRNLAARKITQGGSTITQQLARTIFLDHSRTWVRKFAEVIIAFKLEKHLTKSEILSAYCDFVYMGRGSRGFEAVSRIVYRKSFEHLDKEKIPALIGLLGAPEAFHPRNNLKKFWDRGEKKARNLGTYIQRVSLNPINISRVSGKCIESSVRSELMRLGLNHRNIKSVELTIDEQLQRIIDKTLGEISKSQDVAQIAAVIICNRTGDVLAEASWIEGQPSEFSPAFSGRIQPGSTFKTFALLSAIEFGLSTDTSFESSPYQGLGSSEKSWRVRNYGNNYHGQLTLEEAFVKSDNSVFARLAESLSLDELASTYNRFSLSENSSFTRAAALGGVREGVSLLQIANAYASIARNGVAVTPRFIRLVQYREGNSAFINTKSGQVIANYADIQELKRVLAVSGVRSGLYGFSGKTGTTSKGSLFSGYNEDISISLWLDFKHQQPENAPKALTAIKVMKKLSQKLLDWSSNRALEIL